MQMRPKSWYDAPEGFKRCPSCEEFLLLDAFYVNHSVKAGAHQRQGTCKACCRAAHLTRTYGLSTTEFTRLWQAQNERCAICRTESDLKLHVDHDHDSGAIRGILCSGCNKGIGFLKDDIEIVRSALHYLEGNLIAAPHLV